MKLWCIPLNICIISLSNNAYEEIFQEIDTTGLARKRGLFIYGPIKTSKAEN